MSLNSYQALQTAYTKTYFNACGLLEEAQLLLDNDKYARTYLLAHISIEEFARCIMLASASIKFKVRALDTKKLIKRQTNHQSKIQVAYSFVEKLKQFKSPLSVEDRMEILGHFDKVISDDDIQKLDDLKNASFYTDQYENQTKMPSEVITSEKANEILSSANLLKELIEANNWHEGENLINTVKRLDNDQINLLKTFYYGDQRKV
ncbi:AbiV family abortive infection protein [Bacillus sp. JJ1122]|uniref:AbiV family abortive infection protein n=1 Tax=Bacillus sp. JJ1122 TaxID=3122951 RepID=UPI002FFFCC63